MAKPVSADHLLPLLRLLSASEWTSGEQLALNLGLSRAGIGKQIKSLTTFGVTIDSQKGVGYRLKYPVDLLEQTRIAEQLVSLHPALSLSFHTSTASTNDLAMTASAAHDPQVFFAEHQTGGRGRLGRTWQSPLAQHIYLSVAWTFTRWPDDLPALSLAIGVSVCESLNQRHALSASIKWPNDIVVDGQKLAGILTECRGEPHGGCRVIIGVGLNIGDEALNIEQPWTNLRRLRMQHANGISRSVEAAMLVVAIHGALRQFSQRGFSGFRSRFNDLDATLGRSVMVHTDPPYDGVGHGVDQRGNLTVSAHGSVHTLHSGEVSIRLQNPAVK